MKKGTRKKVERKFNSLQAVYEAAVNEAASNGPTRFDFKVPGGKGVIAIGSVEIFVDESRRRVNAQGSRSK
jgi:hypothetical protein